MMSEGQRVTETSKGQESESTNCRSRMYIHRLCSKDRELTDQTLLFTSCLLQQLLP